VKDLEVIPEIWGVLKDRLAHPREGSYVGRLARGEKGIDGILEKVGEEAVEFILSVKSGDRGATISEAADLEFHLLLALAAAGVDIEEVLSELRKRRHPKEG
jgi:phosphoribosyl-ATP pyrophosphohydrolase